jgi:hypothetical protein
MSNKKWMENFQLNHWPMDMSNGHTKENVQEINRWTLSIGESQMLEEVLKWMDDAELECFRNHLSSTYDGDVNYLINIGVIEQK